jgi:hypothetical protein
MTINDIFILLDNFIIILVDRYDGLVRMVQSMG